MSLVSFLASLIEAEAAMGNNHSEDSSSTTTADEHDTEEDEEENRTTTAKQSDDDDDDNEDKIADARSASDRIESDIWKPPNVDDLYKPHMIARLVASIPDVKQKSAISSTHGSALIRYLESRIERGETTIERAQFMKALCNVPIEYAERCFNLLDTGGRRIIDAPSAIQYLRSGMIELPPLGLGFAISTTMLQQCDLMPGIADVRSKTVSPSNYESNIDQFLQRSRVTAEFLPSITDVSLDSVFCLRKYIIDSWLNDPKYHSFVKSIATASTTKTAGDQTHATKSAWPRPPTAETTDIGSGDSTSVDIGSRLMTRCYESINVSSNAKDKRKLTDGDTSTFWQSDGRAGAHYIDIVLKKNVVVSKLAIYVSTSDKNFVPSIVTLSVGDDIDGALRPYARPAIEIPSTYRGYFTLMTNTRRSYRRIRINIKRCHSGGCDTRIRGIDIQGYQQSDQEMRDAATTPLEEAGIIWYLNMLMSMAETCAPIVPSLKRTIVDHTKLFTDRLSPLCLTECEEFEATASSSKARSVLLSPNVLDTVEKSLKFLVTDSDDQLSMAAVEILSSLALARFNCNSILRVVEYLINLKSPVPENVSTSVKRSMENAISSILANHSTRISCGVVSVNNIIPEAGEDTCDRRLSPPSGESFITVALRPPSGSTTMVLSRIVVKMAPTWPRASTTAVVYAFSSKEELTRFTELAPFFPLSNTPAVKRIGHSDVDVSTELTSEVEIYLEPCQCKFIVVWFSLNEPPRQPKNADRMSVEKMLTYGFVQSEKNVREKERRKMDRSIAISNERAIKDGKSYLSTVWNEADDSNPNVKLASHLLLFVNTIHSLAYDIEIDGLDIGLSSVASNPFDLDHLCSLFEIVIKQMTNESSMFKLVFVQFVADLFRHRHRLLSKVKGCDPSKLRQFLQSVVQLSIDGTAIVGGKWLMSSLIMEIIANGISIFHPSEMDRRLGLFDLLPGCSTNRKEPITRVMFLALCKSFSGSNASQLIDMPYGTIWTNLDTIGRKLLEDTDRILEKLFVAYVACLVEDFATPAKTKEMNGVALCNVINAQLLRLFGWRKFQLTMLDSIADMAQRVAFEAFLDTLPVRVATITLRHLKQHLASVFPDKRTPDEGLARCLMNPFAFMNDDWAIVGSAFNFSLQLTTAVLGESIKDDDLRELLDEWTSIVHEFDLSGAISKSIKLAVQRKYDELFNDKNQLVELRRWSKIESTHPSESPSHIEMHFYQPGAVVFEIEFSSKCSTAVEDPLIFYDHQGVKTEVSNRSYEKKSWPTTITIRSRDQLYFVYHAENKMISAKSWGYQFAVVAKGIPTPSTPTWMSDLSLSLAQLGGRLVSRGFEKIKRVDSNQNDGSNGDPAVESSKALVEHALTAGIEYLQYFRSIENAHKSGASMVCLSFLRESLDAACLLVNSSYMKGLKSDDALSVALVRYWNAIVETKNVLAKEDDQYLWLVHILHTLPWSNLNFANTKGDPGATSPCRLVSLIFETASIQQNVARKQPFELTEEPINGSTCATFQDWLAIMRLDTTGSVRDSLVNEAQFHVWHQAKINSSSDVERQQAHLFMAQYSDILQLYGIYGICDGCNERIDGIRYRCLECFDVDVCTQCLFNGKRPIRHSNEHRMVPFDFICDRCKANIIGSRYRCKSCEDYDLCFGCTLKMDDNDIGYLPHKSSHEFVGHPPKCVREEDSETLQYGRYVSQTAWLMASKLGLRLFTKDGGGVDRSPWSSEFGRMLLEKTKEQCLSDVGQSVMRQAGGGDSRIRKVRRELVERETCERLLGLIALSSGTAGENWAQLRDAIVLMYRILKSECGETRSDGDFLALHLLGKLCLLGGPELADDALNESSRTPVLGSNGMLTLQFLFIFGSSCLTSMQLRWPSAVARIWTNLLEDARWSRIAGEWLEKKMVTSDDVSVTEMIFAYLVFTGFPGSIGPGSNIEYTDSKGRARRGTILEAAGMGDMLRILSPESRQLYLINATAINRCVAITVDGEAAAKAIDSADLISDCQLAVAAISHRDDWNNQAHNYDQFLAVALAMKAVSNSIDSDVERNQELFGASFAQELVQIASRPTNLPMGVRAEMIENYIVTLLDKSTSGQSNSDTPPADDEDGEDDDDRVFGATSQFMANFPSGVRTQVEGIQKKFGWPISIVKAISEANPHDHGSLMLEMTTIHLNRSMARNQDIFFRAAQFERYTSAVKAAHQRFKKEYALVLDTGIGSTAVMDVNINNVLGGSKYVDTATLLKEVKYWGPIGLIDSDSGKVDDIGEKSRNAYAEEILFVSFFEKKSRASSMNQLAAALAILYARKLLAQLIASWPKAIEFSELHFGFDRSYFQLLSVLDLFNISVDCIPNVPRVVDVIFQRCSNKKIRELLVYGSCQLLVQGAEETTILTYVDGSIEKFDFPKASAVRALAKFELGKGTICFTYDDPISGGLRTESPAERPAIDVVLNTNSPRLDFAVTGKARPLLKTKLIASNFRYFESGYLMMKRLLDAKCEDESILPTESFSGVWAVLIWTYYPASGRQRLKLIDLLTRLVTCLSRQEATDQCRFPLDLKLIAPLWKELTEMNTDCAKRRAYSLPESGQSLANFFFVLESAAIEWKVDDELAAVMAMCDSEEAAQRSFDRGRKIVASICAAIGIENATTKLVRDQLATMKSMKRESDIDDGRLYDLYIAVMGHESDDDDEDEDDDDEDDDDEDEDEDEDGENEEESVSID